MWMLLASLAVAQGGVVRLEVPDAPGLVGVEVEWAGRAVPFVQRDGEWFTVIGVDLDTPPGPHAAELALRFVGGRVEHQAETIAVGQVDFPTTALTVEPRYVEPPPEDRARAEREAAEIAAVYANVTPEVYWSEPFAVPIPGIDGGRNFGHRRVFNGQPRAPHSGADLSAATGTPVHASNGGRVVLAKDLFYSGNAVFIDHGLGMYTTYLHLSEILVAPGDAVEKGQVIGLAGATGRVTGPHLHWGVRIIDARVDPFSLLEVVR